MPLPPNFNLDTATPAQMLAVLGTLTVAEFVGVRQMLKNRHGIEFPVPTALGVTGPQAAGGPVPNLTTFARQEWLAQIRAGLAFCAANGIILAAATAQVALRNPGGPGATGVKLLVYGVEISNDTAGRFELRINTTAIVAGPIAGSNLRLSGPTVGLGVSEFVTPFVASGSQLENFFAPANSRIALGFGQGYLAELDGANGFGVNTVGAYTGTFSVTFYWAEVPAAYF